MTCHGMVLIVCASTKEHELVHFNLKLPAFCRNNTSLLHQQHSAFTFRHSILYFSLVNTAHTLFKPFSPSYVCAMGAKKDIMPGFKEDLPPRWYSIHYIHVLQSITIAVFQQGEKKGISDMISAPDMHASINEASSVINHHHHVHVTHSSWIFCIHCSHLFIGW